jgi:hypothetical protein
MTRIYPPLRLRGKHSLDIPFYRTRPMVSTFSAVTKDNKSHRSTIRENVI